MTLVNARGHNLFVDVHAHTSSDFPQVLEGDKTYQVLFKLFSLVFCLPYIRQLIADEPTKNFTQCDDAADTYSIHTLHRLLDPPALPK